MTPVRLREARSQDTLAEAVRAAMRAGRRPVAVLSTFDGARPVGCAVSAFLCLSLDPPSVLVSMASGSGTLDRVRRRGRFGLSLLGEDQQRLVEVFATGRPTDRFRATGFSVLHGVPLVEGSPGALACAVTDLMPRYDHTLLLGDVLAVGAPAAATGRRCG